ncbi:hypothetical protein PLESTB_001897700 [Pleodorina starrii]|uniref:Conjugal transfer protein n=1 Tax=Pleodorina starrii TaxID=330485 RepID=A0A9W6C2S8_9CHLO|nr:hypothetical protein PLESTB_001897700 [Pleodorina starrii]
MGRWTGLPRQPRSFNFDAVPGGSAFVMKPTTSGAATNINVYTNKRQYYFEVWDDGAFTYFKFRRNGELPAIFKVTAGQEVTVNSQTMPDGVVRVTGTSPFWVLRLGSVESTVGMMKAVSSDNSEVVELIRGLQDQIDRLSEAPAEDADAVTSKLPELKNDLDMLRLQNGQSVMPGGDDDLLTQRRQAADEAAQLEEARLQSSMVALGGGGGAGGAIADAAGLGDGAAAQQAARLSDDAQFVRDAGRPVQVQRAEIIVNPSNTVTQGTMIQAVLETAIDSTLQGPIRGLVTTDVVAYDGSRILIPRGSRLIGSYSADVETGQNRLLVAWERIIMPDNQSVQISSFGGDALGRSGTTGKVNNHFFRRLGAAALISTISAIPSALQDDSGDGGVTISTGGSTDPATGVSNAVSGATESAIGKYVSMPPTITVNQGTRITVMVDRDLEIF